MSTKTSPISIFLSYAHEEAELARRLERDLRRFARPVFGRARIRALRDELNLRPTHDLWASIQEHLGRCEFLVLVASPASAQSPWVAREVAHFTEHHPLANVLLLLARGDIVWAWEGSGGTFDRARTTALPVPVLDLYKSQPLFVDLRWTFDVADPGRDARWRAALVDVASVVTGLDKETAAAEDARARQRALRLAAGSAAVLAALLIVASSLGVLAHRNAQTAERRLRASQDHVGQLLGVVDSEMVRLRGAGLARRSLLAQSRILLDRLGRAESRERLRVGAVLDALEGSLVGAAAAQVGDKTEAREAYARASAAAETLIDDPVPGARMAGAAALLEAGTWEFEMGNLDRAVHEMERARVLRAKLYEESASAARALDLATVVDRLGVVELRKGNLDAAERLHRQGRDLVHPLAADETKPDVRALALAESEMLLFDVVFARSGLKAHQVLKAQLEAASGQLDSIDDRARLDVARRRLDLELRFYRLMDPMDAEAPRRCSSIHGAAFELFASEGESVDALRLADALAVCPLLEAEQLAIAARRRAQLEQSRLPDGRLVALLRAAEGMSRAAHGMSDKARTLLVQAATAMAPMAAFSPGDWQVITSLARSYQYLLSIPGWSPADVSEWLKRCTEVARSDPRLRIDCYIAGVPDLATIDVAQANATAMLAVDEAAALEDQAVSGRLRFVRALCLAAEVAWHLGEFRRSADLLARADSVFAAAMAESPASPATELMRKSIEWTRKQTAPPEAG